MKSNKKTKNEKTSMRGRYSLLSVFVIGLILGIMIVPNLYVEEDKDTGKKRILLTSLSASDTGDGVDAIVNIYIYPLSEKTDITSSPYECNEGDAYEHGDDVDGFDDGEELADSTPAGSTYMICVEVNYSSKAYNTTSSDWDKTLVEAEITCAELSLSSETMTEATDFSQQDGTTSAHMTFYVDDGGSGFEMTTGNSITVTDLDIYYYG